MIAQLQKIGRELTLAGAAVMLAMTGSVAHAQAPKSPVVINVVDVGGALALLQDAIEAYKTKNPTYVSRFTFTKAPAPELPGKLKAMQDAEPRRHRAGARRPRHSVRRHRAEALGADAAQPRRQVSRT